MEQAHTLDMNATASLLCYLVVSDLASLALQDAPLTDANPVESARIWLARHAVPLAWLERVTLVRRARQIAKRMQAHAS